MRRLISIAVLTGSLLAAGAAGAQTVNDITTTKGSLDKGVLSAGDNLRNNGAYDSTSDHSHRGPTAYILDEGLNQGGDETFLLHFDEAGTAFNTGEVSGSFQFDLSPGQTLVAVDTTTQSLLASDDLSNGVSYQRCTFCTSGLATAFRGLEPSQTPFFGDSLTVTHGANPLIYTVNYDFRNDGATMDEARFVFSPAGGVPEPASWALMIGGFGMAGAMMRRRRAVTLAA
jgi:hypothetical protein